MESDVREDKSKIKSFVPIFPERTLFFFFLMILMLNKFTEKTKIKNLINKLFCSSC